MSAILSASLGPAEIEALRQRLEEAEETLRAIREGEVDALVVGGARAAEVLTLEAGPEPYRVFMDAMETGAAALDTEGRVLFANKALCELLGRTAEEMQAGGLFTDPSPALAADFAAALEKGGTERHSSELSLLVGDTERQIHLSVAPLRLGPSFGLAATFTDLTERRRVAAAEESERLARAVIASASEAVVVCDPAGRITHISRSGLHLCEGNPVGSMFDEALPLILPEVTGLPAGEDLLAMAMRGGPVQGIEAVLKLDAGSRNFLVSAAPLIVAGDDTRGCVMTLVDVTERKQAERHQLLLMRELDHRVKNTLAIVSTICARTASSENTVEGFQKAFLGRIHALAATHNLLAEKSWSNLRIGDVVSAELAPYLPEGDERLVLEGLNVWVTPRAATAFGLVVHELATNAAKYGALSTLGGIVSVRGSQDAPGQRLRIEWTESGGPGVTEPTRKGFGRAVITRSLSYAEDGGAELRFLPGGLECVIHIPSQDLPSEQT